MKLFYKRLAQVALAGFVSINAIAYLAAYALSHYRAPGQIGLGSPRPPTSTRRPTDVGLQYTTRRIPVRKSEWIETWLIPSQTSRAQGTVVIFPGNGISKATQLLAPAKVLHRLNYDVLLVDFRGVGGSSGNTKTLGIRESEDVALVVNDVRQSNLKSPVVLYGISMGTAAILRAVAQEQVKPDAIMLELPFTRLLSAVRSRFRVFNIPSFPGAELLVFWGGIQYGFNGFEHNPEVYAQRVKCPTLVLQGKQDRWTSMAEINKLFKNLQGSKQLVVFPRAGHQLLVTADKERWQQNVSHFLSQLPSKIWTQ
jgi:uncharacterized protein